MKYCLYIGLFVGLTVHAMHQNAIRLFSVLRKPQYHKLPQTAYPLKPSSIYMMPELYKKLNGQYELERAKSDRATHVGLAAMMTTLDIGSFAFSLPYECTALLSAVTLFLGAQSMRYHVKVCKKRDVLHMLNKEK